MSTVIGHAAHEMIFCNECKYTKKLLSLLEAYLRMLNKVGYSNMANKTKDKITKYQIEFWTHLDKHYAKIDEEEAQRGSESLE